MLTYSQECIMIDHVLNRKKKHLSKLKEDNASNSTLRVWENFYNKLLNKYCNEVRT